jgi:hypothetical protein
VRSAAPGPSPAPPRSGQTRPLLSFTHRHYISLKCGSGSRLLAHNADPDPVFSV